MALDPRTKLYLVALANLLLFFHVDVVVESLTVLLLLLAPAGVNVGIAGVLFLLPFVMGFQRSCRIALVLFKSQNCVLCHETPFPIPFLSGTFPQENPAENISDRIGMDRI